jgi:K+-transporting ATPase ATPase A chain
LYEVLLFVLVAVFIAGLVIGRTPEYLGKRVAAGQMRFVTLAILAPGLVIIGFTAAAVLVPSAQASVLNPGPHGFTEILYAYASATNGNGSAFAGLAANTDWYNTTLGVAMLLGRYAVIVPVLALAGSFVREPVRPVTSGTLDTTTPSFVTFVLAVIAIIGLLTYVTALALGPIGEALSS